MMTLLKNITSYSISFLLFRRNFLSYIVCVSSILSKNSNSLSRKKYRQDTCILIPRQQSRAQNTSVRIGLNELTEPFDTLIYRPSFKHRLCFSFYRVTGSQGFISYSMDNLLGIIIKTVLQKTSTNRYSNTMYYINSNIICFVH